MAGRGVSKRATLSHERSGDGTLWASGRGAQAKVIADGLRRKHQLIVHIRMTPDRWASFPTTNAFVHHYQALTPAERQGYCEVIPDVIPLRLYFDVEWTAPDDTDDWRDTVTALTGLVELSISNMANVTTMPRLGHEVLYCGRWVDEAHYKYSYHLKYHHLAFANKADLRRFVNQLLAMARRERRLVRAEDGNPRCIVDSKVYGNDQALRLPWAKKWRDRTQLESPACEPPEFWEHPERFLVTVPLEGGLDILRVDSIPTNPRQVQRTVNQYYPVRTPSYDVHYERPNITPVETERIVQALQEAGVPVDHHAVLPWRCENFEEHFSAELPLLPDYRCLFCNRVHERPAHCINYYRRMQRVYVACRRFNAEHADGRSRCIPLDDPADRPSIDPDEPVPFDAEYRADRMLPYEFPDGKTTLLVEGQYGLGKTKALAPMIDRMPRTTTILFLTNRILLARKYAEDFGRFGVQNYEKLRGLPDRASELVGFRVAVCYNSLKKFTAQPFKYDLVIIDEITSVLPDTMNRYTAHDDRSLAVLGDTLQRAGRVIALDANIGRMSYEFLRDLRGGVSNLHTVRNSYRRPMTRRCHQLTNSFEPLVLEHLRAGKKVVVASMSKGFTDKMFDDLKRELGGNTEMAFAKINGESRLAHNCDTFVADDVDTWTGLNCLVYSPSVGAGISFELLHFDELFFYAYVSPGTPTCYDALQMMHRVRQLRDDNLYMYYARELTVDAEKMAMYPSNAPDVMTKFERDDVEVIRALMPRDPPAAGLRRNDDGTLQWSSMWDITAHWTVLLYAHIVMRRVRSLVQFRALMCQVLLDMGYAFMTLDNGAPEDQPGSLHDLDVAARDATREEIRTNLPDIPETLVDAFIPIPDALRYIKETWTWLDSPTELYAKARDTFAAMSGLSTTADPRLPRVHNAVDTGVQQRTWLLKMWHHVVCNGHVPIYREKVVSNEEYQEMRQRGIDWARGEPRPLSGTKRLSDGSPAELSVQAISKCLREKPVQLFGLQVKQAGRTAPVHFSAENLYRLREYAARDPASFHRFVFFVCRNSIERARKQRIPERLEMSNEELGAWWVDGARKL
jgi:hypothetical protein